MTDDKDSDSVGEQPVEAAEDELSFAEFEKSVMDPASAKEPEKPDDDDEAEADKPRRTRSKGEAHRISVLTARNYDLQRQIDEMRGAAKNTGGDDDRDPDARPDPDGFEFGEADPAYTEALWDWKDAQKEKAREQQSAAQAEMGEFVEKYEVAVVNAEKAAKEKYPDFDAVIEAAVSERDGQPLPSELSLAISISPVAADVIYRLASSPDASDKIERAISEGSPERFAAAFGELEGEFVEAFDDDDLDLADELDRLRQAGRNRARMKSLAAPKAERIAVTNAPAPPSHRARGGSGTTRVDEERESFAAFEKRIMG